ncbi:hypothetical protein ACFSTC_57660 [Nonomuraea ferruginea]
MASVPASRGTPARCRSRSALGGPGRAAGTRAVGGLDVLRGDRLEVRERGHDEDAQGAYPLGQPPGSRVARREVGPHVGQAVGAGVERDPHLGRGDRVGHDPQPGVVRRLGEGGGHVRRHRREVGAVHPAVVDDDLEVVGSLGQPGPDERRRLRRVRHEVDRRGAVEHGAEPGPPAAGSDARRVRWPGCPRCAGRPRRRSPRPAGAAPRGCAAGRTCRARW